VEHTCISKFGVDSCSRPMHVRAEFRGIGDPGPGLPPIEGLSPNPSYFFLLMVYQTRLGLSCRALLIIVLFRPNFNSALFLTILKRLRSPI